MHCRKMAEATSQLTLDDKLTAFDAVAHHGWADDGRGSIDVELSPTAEREEIIKLHTISISESYGVTFTGESHDGTTHWRLMVE